MAGTPLGPDHRFQIGSISKSFAVICALQLEAEGALALDDPLVTHLPWFQVGGGHGTITLRHLLMHRSGLPLGSDPGPSSPASSPSWPGLRPSGSRAPGSGTRTSGTTRLGYALEPSRHTVSRARATARARSRSACTTRLAHIDPDDRCHLADGHESVRPDIPWHPGARSQRTVRPSEGASGQHRLDRRRHGVVRPPPARPRADRVRQMIDGLPDDEGTPYGLGVWITDRDGHQVVGHSGGMVGYVAQMLCDMDAGSASSRSRTAPGGARRSPSTPSTWPVRSAREPTLRIRPGPSADLSAYVGRTGRSRSPSPGIEARGRHGRLVEHAPGRRTRPTIPTMSETFVRFGRSDGERVDHLIAGDVWYPADGVRRPDRVPAPDRMGTHSRASTARTTRGFRPCASRSAGAGSRAEPPGYGHKPLARTRRRVRRTTPKAGSRTVQFDSVVDGRAQRSSRRVPASTAPCGS